MNRTALQACFQQITSTFTRADIPYALVGGQAVAHWVATKHSDRVRSTNNVDLLVHRRDLPRICDMANACQLEYCDIHGACMLVDPANPHPKHATYLIWANEQVGSDDVLPAPSLKQSQILPPGLPVVDLVPLVAMKLQANRKHDLVHLEVMIDVGLIDRGMLAQLPAELAARLEPLLTEAGK